MWKALNPGEKVLTGDTIRYRSRSSHLTASQDKIYEVVKTDLHYFEIAVRAENEAGGEPDRKIIKYMDVGYHISLEIWSGGAPASSEINKNKRTL